MISGIADVWRTYPNVRVPGKLDVEVEYTKRVD